LKKVTKSLEKLPKDDLIKKLMKMTEPTREEIRK